MSGITEDYYLIDAFGKTVALWHKPATGSPEWEYFVHGAEREVRIAPNDGQGLYGQTNFYLNDHLGNTRITYKVYKATPVSYNGQPDDYITTYIINTVHDYFPYGKVLREYIHAADERYLSTQHERDAHTGLDYRGARYYDSDVARFLSTDPWQAKYPEWSTYNYVMGNPIMLVDPNGKGPTGDYFNWKGDYLGSDGKDDKKVYIADSKNSDGTYKNAKDLGVTKDVFVGFISMIWNESSGDKTESYAIANATMNYLAEGGSSTLNSLSNIVSKPNYYSAAVTQGDFDEYSKAKLNSRNEVGAAINALMGAKTGRTDVFLDYSRGADHWDGTDLVNANRSNSHRNYSWSSGSKAMALDYYSSFGKGAASSMANPANWTYKDTGYQMAVTRVQGKTMFQSLQTGNGEGFRPGASSLTGLSTFKF